MKRFAISDYVNLKPTSGALFWRGYSFRVNHQITIHKLFGGVNNGDGTFAVGLYETDWNVPSALIGHIEFVGNNKLERNIEKDIVLAQGVSEATLVPDQWYILAMGRKSGSGTYASLDFNTFDPTLIIGGEDWLADWHPRSGNKRWNWQSQGTETYILNQTPIDDSNAHDRPDIGFFYEDVAAISFNCKIGGTWREITDGWCKVGGVWREITDAWTKVGGVWRKGE